MTVRVQSGGFGLATAMAAVALLSVQSAAARSPRGPRARTLPPAAQKAIDVVLAAARTRDMRGLRGAMKDEFTWDFGGDSDADQAIEEWSQQPRYLPALIAVLRQGCRPSSPSAVECPGRGGLTFRAGFEEVNGRWMFAHFVSGD